MPTGIYKRTKKTRKILSKTRMGKFIGIKNPFFGKKHSKETRKKMSKNSAHNKYWKGKKLSEKTRKKMSLVNMNIHRGELSPLWKGGITSLNKTIRQCFKMRQWISDIFTRDDFTCQDCNIRGGILNAHHIKRFAIIVKENGINTLEEALLCEELWNLNNGKTLCKKCHKKIPTNA